MDQPPKPVLVVDDDQTLRDVIAETLRGEGYAVDVAANGADALESLRRALPDLVLLDMVMPGMDGRGFIDACRQDPTCAALPIVVVSATHAVPELAEELNIRATLAKPFDMAVLLLLVERLTHRAPS